MMGATYFEAEAFDLSGLGDGIDDPYWYVLVMLLVANNAADLTLRCQAPAIDPVTYGFVYPTGWFSTSAAPTMTPRGAFSTSLT
jgi:hypothetical protein